MGIAGQLDRLGQQGGGVSRRRFTAAPLSQPYRPDLACSPSRDSALRGVGLYGPQRA